ncbi:MAG TPA: hypothetical protein VMW17_06585 [Candidatus Binatia bacterium]|nr:hypothetical protein [Candidatus Binatia bacterium]
MAEPTTPDFVARPCAHPEAYPAERYGRCDELFLVTCYFNSNSFRTRRETYDRFAQSIRGSGLNLLTVECAFGDADFTLPPGPGCMRVRSRDVMWQKERLINLAVASLPTSVRKVAWLDCDVLFSNSDWAIQTAALLDTFPIVQTFKTAIRLPRSHTSYRGLGEVWSGFAWVSAVVPEVFAKDYAQHGHTGFGWAARRDLLDRHGLYDACISGSGDHLMAHAMRGDLSMKCGLFPTSPKLREHFRQWAKAFHADVSGQIGSTPGTLLHLWHGDTKDRRYIDRHEQLVNLDFDPAADLRIGRDGLWEWASDKPEFRRWMRDYFESRKEDGDGW